MSERQTISVPEAAKRLGISTTLGYRLARKGELPGAFRIGQRSIKVSLPAFDAFLRGEK